ncbi:rhodanese-like domain-containing protein, partial [Enterococcus faecalis]
MSILWVINGILLVIVLAMVFNQLYLKIMVFRSAKMLTEEEFKETMRKAQ